MPQAAMKQSKAQIGVELLPRQHGAGGAIGQAGEATPDFRQVRAERLRVLLKAERGRLCLVAVAVGQLAHRLFAGGQKPVEAASEVFERAFDARQIDAVLGPVARILDCSLQQRLGFVHLLAQVIGQRLLGGDRGLQLVRAGRVQPQHAHDVQFVAVGADVEFGDQPRQRQLVVDDVVDLLAVKLLHCSQHADHRAEQRQQNSGQQKYFLADAHGNPGGRSSSAVCRTTAFHPAVRLSTALNRD
jgi:hypothetical protein